jgi:hypothetical protein
MVWELLITSSIIIFGWFIVNLLSSRRDRVNKRLDLKAKYLIEAWYKLDELAATEADEVSPDFNKIIANIQLFGSKRQILLINKVIEDISQKQGADLRELMMELRQEIRKDLNMEFIPENVEFIKFCKKIG